MEARRKGSTLTTALKIVSPQVAGRFKEELRNNLAPGMDRVSHHLAQFEENIAPGEEQEPANSPTTPGELTLGMLASGDRTVEVNVAALESLLDDMKASLSAFKESFDRRIDAGEPDNVHALLSQLEQIRDELKKNGGKDLRPAMLYTFMGLGYASTFAGAILAATSDVSQLRNLNARGAVHAAGSVFGQVLAQCLHLAIPDNLLDKGWKKNVKSLGISLAGTVLEFTQQQAGFTLMDQGRALAGQYPEAPGKAWPTKSQMRSVMETTRAVLTTLFNRVMLGEPIEPQHAAGLLISSAFSGMALGWGNKIAGEQQHHRE